jgi:hypothetical protein
VRNLYLITQQKKSGDNYLRRFVVRVTSMGRGVRLRRQLAEIEQRSVELPRSYRTQLAELIARECTSIEESADPGTYGSQTTDGVTMDGLDVGYERAKSDNVQIRMRGLALWIALVYQETRGTAADDGEELHRQVLRIMRTLKVFSSRQNAGENQG